MNAYETLHARLLSNSKTWLITGVAGFIGSNLLEKLLKLNQQVIGLDDFSTGHQHNLDEVQSLVTKDQWARFRFIVGDIRDLDACEQACHGVEIVLHQAALGSVPRSIEDPATTNAVNIDGFVNMLIASRNAGVNRFVYAASSSTYGDHPDLPKVEDRIGNPLSPYAVTKLANELYANVFASTYGMSIIGLRYFNVFGQRQDPNGAYAAVIPKWFASMIRGEDVFINGDGETSRDFCFIDNCVQINLLAAATENVEAVSQVYNVAFGECTTLNQLFASMREVLSAKLPEIIEQDPVYRDFRAGDVRHSLADISKATRLLGYKPTYSLSQGLSKTAPYFTASALAVKSSGVHKSQ